MLVYRVLTIYSAYVSAERNSTITNFLSTSMRVLKLNHKLLICGFSGSASFYRFKLAAKSLFLNLFAVFLVDQQALLRLVGFLDRYSNNLDVIKLIIPVITIFCLPYLS